MSRFLRQSTASQTRTIGPFVDDTDFKTLKNALTIANTDILLKKNGAASAAKNSGGATADGSGGMYSVTFDATDTDTVGEIFGSVKVAGALVAFFSFFVLEEAVYDAMYAASAYGPLQSTIAGRTLDVTAGGNAGIDWGNIESQSASVTLGGTLIGIADVVNTASNCTISALTSPVLSSIITGVWTNLSRTLTGDVSAVLADTVHGGFNTQIVCGLGILSDITGNITGNLTGNVIGTLNGDVVGSVGSVVSAVNVVPTSVRSAIGMATNDLDAQLDSISGQIDDVLAAIDSGSGGGNDPLDGIIEPANGVLSLAPITLRDAHRAILSFLFGLNTRTTTQGRLQLIYEDGNQNGVERVRMVTNPQNDRLEVDLNFADP